jgi:hypothetical protein
LLGMNENKAYRYIFNYIKFAVYKQYPKIIIYSRMQLEKQYGAELIRNYR